MLNFQTIRRSHPGFLMMEVLIGIAVFGLFVSAVGVTLLYGQENTIMAGDRIRATHLAQQALDGARSIRDASFDNLSAGQHGAWVDPVTHKWAFTGSYIVSSGSYITHVYVTELDDDWLRIAARTRWKHGYNRSGSVLLTTEFTDWREQRPVGNWANLTLEGSWTDASTPVFSDIVLYDDYAFATSTTADGGDGLYIFDISSSASPTRVSSSFDLGETGYAVLVKGQRLYVLTSSSSSEIRVYDISNPASFSSANLVAAYNLPGSGLGRSLGLRGDTLIVGAAESATGGNEELYTFDISNSGSVVFQDSLDAPSTVHAIAVSGTSALLAMSDNAMELTFAKIDDPTNISFPSNQAYNAADTHDGTAIAVSGTSAILGRSNGVSIDEMIMINLEGGGGYPSPPPGPWFHEVGGAVNDIAADPTRCYAFLATEFVNEDLQVVKIGDDDLPEVDTYDSTTGFGQALVYDIGRDRVFMMTDRSLLIFRPGAGTNSCS